MPRRRSGPRMYQRPGRKVWYASLDDQNKHISLGTESEADAKVEFAKLLERRRVRELAPSEKSLIDIWKVTRERAATNNTPKTAYELHLNLRRILSWLDARGIYRARQVDKQIVEDYKTARRFEEVSAARINREIDSWRRAWKVAVELRCAPRDDLVDLFQKLREPRPEPHRSTRTKAQLARLLQKVDPRYKCLLRTALGSGLRDEELRHLEAPDVRAHELAVTPKPGWTTKSYHYRVIPISAATRKAALAWIAARDAGLSLDKKWVWKIMHRGCKAAGIPPTSLHELRRAWASHLYADGVPLKTISKWLGHADAATTERYLRVTGEGLPKGIKLPW